MTEKVAPQQFPLVDRFHSLRLGVELTGLKPGRTVVVETQLRLRREESYGYLRALWWLWLEDGRTVISLPPGSGAAARVIAERVRSPEQLFDQAVAWELTQPVNGILCSTGCEPVDRVLLDLVFACNADLLRGQRFGECRRLTDEGIPPAAGLKLPTHCFPDGIAYGVVTDGLVASVAYAHRTGIVEDLVADLGVETAPRYRRRAYAKTAVAAVVEHITTNGGEARYGCSPGNRASIATARSVGFVPYGRSLILSAPAPELWP